MRFPLNMSSCQVYAHRGGAGLYPENTLIAYQHAIALGVDVLDVDISMTRDKVIVASHDPYLSPYFTRDNQQQWIVTNGLLIKNFDFEDLQDFDVGRLNLKTEYAKLYPKQIAVDGTRIPSVQAIIDLLKQTNSSIRLQLEIKTNPYHPEWTFTPEEFMEVLDDLLRKNEFSARTEVHSFDWRNMLYLQTLNSEIKTSYITSDFWLKCDDPKVWQRGYQLAKGQHYPELIASLGGNIWCPDYRDIQDSKLIELTHKQGLGLTTWTVNDRADMLRLVNFGVDGIITDYPNKLLDFLAFKQEF